MRCFSWVFLEVLYWWSSMMIPKPLSTHALLLICSLITHFGFKKHGSSKDVMEIIPFHSLPFFLYENALVLSLIMAVIPIINYLQFVWETVDVSYISQSGESSCFSNRLLCNPDKEIQSSLKKKTQDFSSNIPSEVVIDAFVDGLINYHALPKFNLYHVSLTVLIKWDHTNKF